MEKAGFIKSILLDARSLYPMAQNPWYCKDHEKIQNQIKVVKRKLFTKMLLMKQSIYTNVNLF